MALVLAPVFMPLPLLVHALVAAASMQVSMGSTCSKGIAGPGANTCVPGMAASPVGELGSSALRAGLSCISAAHAAPPLVHRCMAGRPLPAPTGSRSRLAPPLLQRVSAAGEICVTPMLQHPLWQRRVHWVHLTAEMLPLVPQQQRGAAEGSTGAGSAGGGLAGGGVTDGSSLHDCRVFVAFFQAFMAALSVLLAAWLEAPRASAAAAAQAAAGAASAAAATDAPGGTRGTGWLTRSRRWLKGLVAEAEATLRQLCDMLSGRSWPGVAQLASWCLLLSFLWNLAAWLEEPLPALPGQTA